MLQRVTTTFHSDRRSVLNDMVVTHKVSRSDSKDSDIFSWIEKVLDSLDKKFFTLP